VALRILVFGHWANVERRVRLKVPSADVEDVTADVIYSAVRSAFSGASVGEFVSWLDTITRRRIADYHRARQDPPVAPDFDLVDPSADGLVETQDAIERVLAQLSEAHRAVVLRHVLDGVPAREVAVQLGVGEDNVAQIASRFRRRLRAALGEDER